MTEPVEKKAKEAHDVAKVTTDHLEDPIVNILAGNQHFCESRADSFFDDFQTSQTPAMTTVMCSDSRVNSHVFGFDTTNNAFVIRNIGNQVDTALDSVKYGISHLQTSMLLVMGHSGCGAVAAAMGDLSLDLAREVLPIATHIEKGECTAELWKANVEKNVDFQVNISSQLFASQVKDGSLIVLGCIYDFHDWYKLGRGALVVTNLNGMTAKKDILAHPSFKNVTEVLQRNILDRPSPAAKSS
eukprot:m.11489 g.11489  ORF g.11489 m.11489 type:complete len:243 (+) comp5734_c0_seq1:126-854(+)